MTFQRLRLVFLSLAFPGSRSNLQYTNRFGCIFSQTHMLCKQPTPKKYEEYSSKLLNDSIQEVLKEYFGSIDVKVKDSNKL